MHPNEEGIVESNKYITYSPLSLGTGIYYATVTVNNSANTSTFFTDSIGFVIRNGVTTRLEGKYHKNETTGNEFNVSSGTNTGTTNTVDIKEWGGNEFSDGGIYTITERKGEYQFVCSEPTNRNKVLEDKNIVINLNGNMLFNALIKSNNTTQTKTYFTITSGFYLSIINKSGTGNDSIYGFNKDSFKNNDKFLSGITKPDFIVDSGTLIIVSTDSNGHITVTGCPIYVPVADTTNDYRHAAIDITSRGWNVNLIVGSSGVTINETVRGISTIVKTTTSYAVTNVFNVNINISNASILTSGSNTKTTEVENNYDIYLDGKGKIGKIVINVGDSNHSASITSSGSIGTYTNYGIYVENFNGDVEINISNGSTIDAGSGYASTLIAQAQQQR